MIKKGNAFEIVLGANINTRVLGPFSSLNASGRYKSGFNGAESRLIRQVSSIRMKMVCLDGAGVERLNRNQWPFGLQKTGFALKRSPKLESKPALGRCWTRLYVYSVERGHLGRSGLGRSRPMALSAGFPSDRCCCGQDGRAPLKRYTCFPRGHRKLRLRRERSPVEFARQFPGATSLLRGL